MKIVVKLDGLANGKGVFICETDAESFNDFFHQGVRRGVEFAGSVYHFNGHKWIRSMDSLHNGEDLGHPPVNP